MTYVTNYLFTVCNDKDICNELPLYGMYNDKDIINELPQ